MSHSEKTSPLKSACQSATQSISTAENLIQGVIEPNSIDDIDAPSTIRALQALRHKAMISDQIDRQKRCESIISELTVQKESRSSSSLSNRKKSRRSTSRQGSIRGDSLSNYSSLQQDDSSVTNYELNDEEMEEINQIIDNLLAGDEIESIDPEGINQLKYALKERRKLYMKDGNYLLVKIIEEQLLNLARIKQDNKNSATINSTKNIEKNNNLINEAQNKLRYIKKKIDKLKKNLEEELNKIEESKEVAKTKIFKEIEDDAKLIEEETNEVDLGFSFKPSSDLLEMRSLETKYAKVSRFEAAAELRKMADELETQERKAYDQNARAAINKKEHKKRLVHEQKSQKCNEYFQNIREKTIKKYNKWIEASNKEAEAVRERIRKLQEQHSSFLNESSNNNYNENQIENENYLDNITNEEESIDNIEFDFNDENSNNNIENEELNDGSFTEQQFREHERNIYTPFNSKLPDSSTSPYVGLTEMNEIDQKGQTSPVSSKNEESVQSQNADNDQENEEASSEIKIDANQSVQDDQGSDGEKLQNESSENNQAKQTKTKRTKKVVRKVVKKTPKKST